MLLGGSNVHWLGGDSELDDRLTVVADTGSVRFTGTLGGGDDDSDDDTRAAKAAMRALLR